MKALCSPSLVNFQLPRADQSSVAVDNDAITNDRARQRSISSPQVASTLLHVVSHRVAQQLELRGRRRLFVDWAEMNLIRIDPALLQECGKFKSEELVKAFGEV